MMMNNYRFDYGKKYHYLLKYIIMSIPVLLLVLSFLFPKKQITNNYSVDSQTTINYKYQTNEVNSVDDLIDGNIYYVNYSFDNSLFLRLCVYDLFFIDDFEYVYYGLGNSYFNEVPFFAINSDGFSYVPYKNNNNNSYLYFLNDSSVSFIFVYKSDLSNLYTNIELVSICPQEYIPIENTTITNNINDNSSVVSVDEVRTNNTDYLKPLNDFYKLNINSWYDNLLSAMNLDLDNDTTYFIYHIPLYIVYLYIFDIILDLFGMVFRLGHKLISKVGGDY